VQEVRSRFSGRQSHREGILWRANSRPEAAKGILVTTSGYSAQAKKFAETLPIELIDGTMLAELFTQHRD
jgi:restriction endonuclease Mrr